MEPRFRSPQHLETKPKFGWSYPEAQIGTWMSYDTENHKIFLKKLLKNGCKIKMKSIPKVKGQMTAFLFIKGFGRLSVNWYDMRIREKERQMEQSIGKSKVRSSESDSNAIEEAISLTEVGSTSSGKEVTKQDSSIVRILATTCCTFEPFKDTQEEKLIPPEMLGLNAGLIAEGRGGRETRHTQCASHR